METVRITVIGAGTIGISFAALYLLHTSSIKPVKLIIYDVRTDLESHVRISLSSYLVPSQNDSTTSGSKGHEKITAMFADGTLRVTSDLVTAVSDADIIQEQGPENLAFKSSLWPQVERSCPANCLLWSSTSGIPASQQSKDMRDPSRLVVVHPYNPPHLMPLLEVVPSPVTRHEVISRTLVFWKELGREPVIVRKEINGFIANRLAFALLREAIQLVNDQVTSVEDIDKVVQSSMGPRWAIAGPFKSYHAGGGSGGLRSFFKNVGGTIQSCWEECPTINVGDGWEEDIFRQTDELYGVIDTVQRDRLTKRVLHAAKV